MLESRSAYGYYGIAGGATGEKAPDEDFKGFICVNMKYYDYKRKYPNCRNLGDYDKVGKTITVLIPEEVADRPNFGNRYKMHVYRFMYEPVDPEYNDVVEFRAKNYENAIRNARKWARDNGKTIIGEAI